MVDKDESGSIRARPEDYSDYSFIEIISVIFLVGIPLLLVSKFTSNNIIPVLFPAYLYLDPVGRLVSYFLTLLSFVLFSMAVVAFLDRKSAKLIGKLVAIGGFLSASAEFSSLNLVSAFVKLVGALAMWIFGDIIFWMFAQVGGFVMYMLSRYVKDIVFKARQYQKG